MKTQITAAQNEIIEHAMRILDGMYSVNMQTTHPEYVSEETLNLIQESAEDLLIDVKREELEQIVIEDELDPEYNDGHDLLTIYASFNCENYGSETATPVVESHTK